MKFGYFDDKRREYVITTPETPLPWFNYLGTQDFYGIVSNTGGGYTFYKDSRFRRLTRYRYNNIPMDEGGRYLYLRDNQDFDNQDFHQLSSIWAATWQPIRNSDMNYRCRHGLGYSIIETNFQQIQTEITFFIPIDATTEIWKVKVTNQRTTPANLSLFSFIEFCLWNAQDDMTNFQRNFNTAEVEVQGSTIYHKTEYRERRNHFAFFSCSEEICGFDTDREVFLGKYRGLHNPAVVEQGSSQDSIVHGWSPIGSHQINLKLAPQESKTLVFLLGYYENPQNAKFDQSSSPCSSQKINKAGVHKVISQWLNLENVNSAFSRLKSYWETKLQQFQVHTPDPHTNRMVNIWNQYQNMVTFNLSRSASFFESGISRGIGFRDSNQDLLGFVHLDPFRARQRILDLAATQLTSGGAYHQYQPLTKLGNNAIGSNFNDDPLWLVLSVAAYLKETGDNSILDEEIPFENQLGTEAPLVEHLRLSLHYTQNRLGPHGLPLIGRADWNDCLNLNSFSSDPDQSFQTTTTTNGSRAESVFIAGLFHMTLSEYQEILRRWGNPSDVALYKEWQRSVENAVITHGWDGDWFLRAYNDAGNQVGSKTCSEGKIFIEPQGICSMAGIGYQHDYPAQALQSVETYLSTRHGIMLLAPPYSQYDLSLGEISSYPPGYKENGSIFCHTNPWIIIAESKFGNPDRAFLYYQAINPSYREKKSDIHKCEPYVYAQTIAGKSAPTFGEAKNSWLTGTAAWNFVAIIQWILGIRPSYEGLIVEPHLPSNWEGFQASREFRGKLYQISVKRSKNNPKNFDIEINGRKFNSTHSIIS